MMPLTCFPSVFCCSWKADPNKIFKSFEGFSSCEFAELIQLRESQIQAQKQYSPSHNSVEQLQILTIELHMIEKDCIKKIL